MRQDELAKAFLATVNDAIGVALVVPLAKRGDSNRFLDGSHDADDSAPTEETYLCIHMNAETS